MLDLDFIFWELKASHVAFLRPKDKQIAIFDQTNIIFLAVNFFQILVIKTLKRVRIDLKCWIRHWNQCGAKTLLLQAHTAKVPYRCQNMHNVFDWNVNNSFHFFSFWAHKIQFSWKNSSFQCSQRNGQNLKLNSPSKLRDYSGLGYRYMLCALTVLLYIQCFTSK